MKLQTPHHPRLLIAGFLLLASALAPSHAQTQTPAPATAQQPPAQPPAAATAQTVKLNVIVAGEGASSPAVADLRQEDFRVEEDGTPQTITYFAREELPVSYALVLDNSGSTRTVLGSLIDAGGALVSANKPADETMIVRFVGTNQISVLRDFTGNQQALMRALEEMYSEGGQTAIIDAVYLAAERVGRRTDEAGRRRALVLFTDGEDRASTYKLSELQQLLRRSDVQIFVVGFVAVLPKDRRFSGRSSREEAQALLNRLAEESGGRAFYPKNAAEIRDAVNAIAGELRTQYVIGYQPSNTARDGKFRKVQVKLDKAAGAKRTVSARAGYFAPGGKDAEKRGSR